MFHFNVPGNRGSYRKEIIETRNGGSGRGGGGLTLNLPSILKEMLHI